MFKKQNTAFSTLQRCKEAMVDMRKLAGMSPNHNNYISKYLRACFNENPPSKRKKKLIWDVNILIDYFNNGPSNSELTYTQLGGKAILLIMLTTMCCRADIMQLKLSNVMRMQNGNIRFYLEEPTKTYNEI